MVNDEKSKVQKAGENTACDSGAKVEIPKRPRLRASQKKSGRQKMRPTRRGRIDRVRLGRQNELFSRSHAGFDCFRKMPNAFSAS
jgi:hypothetical protein